MLLKSQWRVGGARKTGFYHWKLVLLLVRERKIHLLKQKRNPCFCHLPPGKILQLFLALRVATLSIVQTNYEAVRHQERAPLTFPIQRERRTLADGREQLTQKYVGWLARPHDLAELPAFFSLSVGPSSFLRMVKCSPTTIPHSAYYTAPTCLIATRFFNSSAFEFRSNVPPPPPWC